MNIEIEVQPPAKRALAQFAKDDPRGIDQVLDSFNLLRRNPYQGVTLEARNQAEASLVNLNIPPRVRP